MVGSRSPIDRTIDRREIGDGFLEMFRFQVHQFRKRDIPNSKHDSTLTVLIMTE